MDTDTLVVTADAILFADVDQISAVPSDPHAVNLHLSRLNVVATRWKLDPGGSLDIHVGGDVNPDGGVTPAGEQPSYRVHGRYLFFLQGGSWYDAPVVQNGHGVYALRDDGTLECAGGQVFGISSFGLICSVQERQAAPPVDEAWLATALTRRVENARLRLPALASQLDTAARPLVLDRSGAAR